MNGALGHNLGRCKAILGRGQPGLMRQILVWFICAGSRTDRSTWWSAFQHAITRATALSIPAASADVWQGPYDIIVSDIFLPHIKITYTTPNGLLLGTSLPDTMTRFMMERDAVVYNVLASNYILHRSIERASGVTKHIVLPATFWPRYHFSKAYTWQISSETGKLCSYKGDQKACKYKFSDCLARVTWYELWYAPHYYVLQITGAPISHKMVCFKAIQ